MNNLSSSIKLVLKDLSTVASTVAGGFGIKELSDMNLVLALISSMFIMYCIIPFLRVFFSVLRDILLDRLSRILSEDSKKHLEKHRKREDALANHAITPPEPEPKKDEPKKDEKPPEEKPSDDTASE